MAHAPGIDRRRLGELTEREHSRLLAAHPRSTALLRRARASMPQGVPDGWMADLFGHDPLWIDRGEGPYLIDVDRHRMLDTNAADTSMFCGYSPEPVVKAVSERIALGPQYLMPNEDAIAVAEELARRWGLPMWRFTIEALAASAGLQWRAHPLGPRAGYAFDGRLPRSAANSHESHDPELYRLLRLWMVNRGVWEAMEWAGPAISVAATDADVDDYVATLGEPAAELTP